MKFEVQDMTCAHCVSRITQTVKDLDASATVEVDLESKQVKVSSQVSAGDVQHAIAEAGFSPTLTE